MQVYSKFGIGKGLIILNICRGIFKFDDKFVLL